MPARDAASARSDERQLIDALVQTSFATMAVLNRVAAEHDLSLTQLRVLAILRDRQVTITDLADYLGLDKSTISGLVDRAAKRGLLRRTSSPHDRRVIDVSLTKAGAALAARGAAQVVEALASLTGRLTALEAARLASLLDRALAGATEQPQRNRPVQSGKRGNS